MGYKITLDFGNHFIDKKQEHLQITICYVYEHSYILQSNTGANCCFTRQEMLLIHT